MWFACHNASFDPRDPMRRTPFTAADRELMGNSGMRISIPRQPQAPAVTSLNQGTTSQLRKGLF
jgi:hypothetical protein